MLLKNFSSALKSFVLLLVLLVLLAPLSSCANADEHLAYTLLDMGGDEAAVLRYKNFSALIDCGRENSFVHVAFELDRQSIKTLDYLFLTHPHDDHCGGAL